jgi:hypothetical protein
MSLSLPGKPAPLARLSESASTAAGIEQRAAELLSSLPSPAPLSPAALARIGARLQGPPPPTPLPTARGPWVAAGVAAVGVATLAAVLVPRALAPRPRVQAPAVRVVDTADRPPAPLAPIVTPLSPDPGPPLLAPTTPPPRQPVRATARPPRASAPAPVAPIGHDHPTAAASAESESGLAAESRLLGIALHQLRQQRDGAAALRSLDTYQQRFPQGLLFEEAQAARVDALLLTEHRSEALLFLERTQFQRLDRGGELRVVRGELRATAGRCREALTDFAAVLAAAATPPLVAERALYGQASCLATLGDARGARSRIELYLERFPSGRFAAAARRALQNLPAAP